MKQLNAEFMRGAAKPEVFPKHNLPEIAFIGRSNVGKSSLLNSIVLRKNLARTSSNPGKTQEINFYLVDDKYVFADLPGFGYAVVSKTQRAEWQKLNLNYLATREQLKLICLLVDSRHDPQKFDLALIEYLESIEKPYILVLTKTDKLPASLIVERKKQLEEVVSICNHCIEVLPYSTLSFTGRKELIAVIKK
jgi:GTP-binding protein